MIRQHLKLAFRYFIRKPVINLLNLTGLSVSLALVIILSSYCYSEFSADNFHQKADRIFLCTRTDKFIHTSVLLKDQIDLSVSSVEASARIGEGLEPLTFQVDDKEPINSNIFFADNEFFKLFTYKSLVGDIDKVLKKPMTLVITKSFAEKLFGTIDVIGKTIKFNNKGLFTIEAVIETPYENSVFSFNAVTSIASKKIVYPNPEEFSNWGWTSFLTFIQFKEGLKTEEVINNILSVIPEDITNERGYKFMQLIPFRELYFGNYLYSFLRKGDKRKVITFVIAAVLILIIALANYINISTAQWNENLRQTGVRKVIGANRFAIMLNVHLESFIFFFTSLIIAIILAYILSPILSNYTGVHFNQKLLLSPLLLLALTFGTLAISMLFNLVPALRISTSNAVHNLKNNLENRTSKSYSKGIMVTGQFVIAMVLIAFTVLVKKQIDFGSSNLGINQENIMAIKLTEQLKENKEVLKNTLLEKSAIDRISFTQYYPGTNIDSWTINGKFNGLDKRFQFDIFSADEEFMKILKLQPVQGRFYDDKLLAAKNKVLVNETFIKVHEINNPFGDKIPFMGSEYEIIGVVKDFHFESVNKPIAPLIIKNGEEASYCLLSLKSEDFKSLRQNMEEIIVEINNLSPAFPVEISFFDQAIENMYQSELQFRKTFTLFAGSAIIICCMGIFAMSLFASQKRTKEIGIRKVNGAKVSEILTMLNKDFVKWVLIAFVVATPVAYYAMNKWLENFVYKTSLSWWIFALAGLLALGIALLTVSWQSWRAATRNPVEALRYE